MSAPVRSDPPDSRGAGFAAPRIAVVGDVGHLTGPTLLGVVATALAPAAALLDAALGFRPGCEPYAVIARIRNNQQGAIA